VIPLQLVANVSMTNIERIINKRIFSSDQKRRNLEPVPANKQLFKLNERKRVRGGSGLEFHIFVFDFTASMETLSTSVTAADKKISE
jgi:hypothetical protein